MVYSLNTGYNAVNLQRPTGRHPQRAAARGTRTTHLAAPAWASPRWPTPDPPARVLHSSIFSSTKAVFYTDATQRIPSDSRNESSRIQEAVERGLFIIRR